MIGLERQVSDVTFSHFQLTIVRSKVYLGETCSTLNYVKQVIDSRERELVIYDDLVLLMLVKIHPTGTIFLLQEQDKRDQG